MTGVVDAASVKALLHGRGEVAFIDVREHGQYGEGHPFLVVNCPFSRLEHTIGGLVPRLSVPVILIDQDDGVAARAAASLRAIGYTDVSCIAGGVFGWSRAGFTLFKGVNLPSKTLGELIEHAWDVPHISAETLEEWRREGKPFDLFDGRPAQEYRKSTIPGARSMPNTELPHRLGATIGDGDTPVVIHCAGRTRSIIGAAGLALAVVENPVYALENGTQGWALSGRKLSYENEPEDLPVVDAQRNAASRERARAVAARHSIPLLTLHAAAKLAAEPDRTTYFFDVRSAQEFAAGSLPGTSHAPAVQLVQAADLWIGVRRARVILTCSTGLRAAITAVFLKAMGFEVHVVADGDAENGTAGTEPPRQGGGAKPTVARTEDLAGLLAQGAALVDLRPSPAYRAAHLEGATWSIRPAVPRLGLERGRPLVLIGAKQEVELVAHDLQQDGYEAGVHWLQSGPAEWRDAGLAVTATPDSPPDAACIDFLFFVHDRHDGNMEAARRYLVWEQGLVGQLDAQERAEFAIGPSPFHAS